MFHQVPIKAGHEFLVSTEDKYSEICDDKVLWFDYVRRKHSFVHFTLMYIFVEKLAKGHCSRQAHLH